MERWWRALFIGSVISVIGVFSFFITHKTSTPNLEAATIVVNSVVDKMIAEREESIISSGDVPFGSSDEINILALGIDSRKEGSEKHCDSIHLITLHLTDWSIVITSVPRGTYSPLPPGGNYQESDYYLANACAYGGLDYGVQQIERVLGVKSDFVAKVGFSEAIGIFRVLGLPTTDTLEWLRSRHVYAIGDPQRQHNQALFMKDTALNFFEHPLPPTFVYLIYRLVDTDMDFAVVKALYEGYLAANIADRPDDISLAIKPYFSVEDIHYDPENSDTQVQSILDFLKGRISVDDLSLDTIDEVQARLVTYLREALANEESIVHVYNEQMWRQVEDDDVREELHFRFLDKYVREIKGSQPEEAESEVLDYILEQQYFGNEVWAEKGRRFLETLAR